MAVPDRFIRSPCRTLRSRSRRIRTHTVDTHEERNVSRSDQANCRLPLVATLEFSKFAPRSGQLEDAICDRTVSSQAINAHDTSPGPYGTDSRLPLWSFERTRSACCRTGNHYAEPNVPCQVIPCFPMSDRISDPEAISSGRVRSRTAGTEVL